MLRVSKHPNTDSALHITNHAVYDRLDTDGADLTCIEADYLCTGTKQWDIDEEIQIIRPISEIIRTSTEKRKSRYTDVCEDRCKVIAKLGEIILKLQ